MSTRAFRNAPTEGNTWHPRLLGTRCAIACEHHLAAHAGAEILQGGGNAVDAAVAAVLVEGLVDPHMHTLGGECPILLRMARDGRTVAVNGNTAAPRAATAEGYRARGLAEVPEEGILAAGVPAAFGALIEALRGFGTLRFAQVAAPAIELARGGFPVSAGLLRQERFGLHDLAQKFLAEWPASAALYLPQGRVPEEGSVLRNPALAAVLESLAELERGAPVRDAGLRRVLDGFYRGDIAGEIERYSREREGLLAREDLAGFETYLEDPVSVAFADAVLFKCGPWNQGPAVLQALRILEHFDLAAMAHNGADYIHCVVEAIKLAWADREQFYADPRQVEVPVEALLSREYASLRARLIDPHRAHPEIRPGDPARGRALLPAAQRLGGKAWGRGTVHVDVIDGDGNMVSATPSGGWLESQEVVGALGFPLGNRLMTFYLDPPHHPNLLAPGKRPRTTVSPSLCYRGGRPWMVFGSMGGDQQDQWQLQFFLNRVVFGHTLPQAIEAPKFSSEHFPGFFAPHDFFRNRLRLEPRIREDVRDEIARRGHDIEVGADWSEGFLLAAACDPDTGVLEAGCDPRGAKSQVFSAQALCW